MVHRAPSPIDSTFISSLCEQFLEQNYIEPELYSRYSVKRGLRNADGTGVLAGITRICNVHGYMVSEGERVPAPGQLTYRGIDLYSLIDGFRKEDRFGFDEVCYLLNVGTLPNREQLTKFEESIALARELPENFTEDVIMRAPSQDLMNKLAYATLALYSYDANPDDISPQNVLRQGIELIAKFPIIISHAYQARRRYFNNESMFLHVPDRTKSTAENILALIRPDGAYTREEARLLDMCLIVHAEHGGGNNSAFTCRVVSSSATDTYSAISAATCSLKGPRHGGANLKVCQMLDDITENVHDITNEKQVFKHLCNILRYSANDGSGLIYGMGHAIYTLSDPRAIVLKTYARHLAKEKGFEDQLALVELVEKLTPRAFAEVRGQERVISANVDLYSGLVYQMLGIPREMFTPLFATSRIAGWMAHRLEEISFNGKIMRPAYKVLSQDAEYIPLDQR